MILDRGPLERMLNSLELPVAIGALRVQPMKSLGIRAIAATRLPN